MQKGVGVIQIILGVLILSLVVGGTYWFGSKRTTTSEETVVRQNPNAPFVSLSPKPSSDKPLPSFVPDETANWKTFIKSGQFSLNYPASWYINDRKDHFVARDGDEELTYQNENTFELFIYDGPPYKMTNPTDEQLIEAIYKYWTYSTSGLGDYDPQETSKSSTTVGGEKATKFTIKLKNPKHLPYAEVYRIYVKHKEKVYSFNLDGKDQKLLQQVLDTFKFVN